VEVIEDLHVKFNPWFPW